MLARATPCCSASATLSRKPRVTSLKIFSTGGNRCMSFGVPRECISTSPAPTEAQTSPSDRSRRSAETSFTMCAPASSAAFATAPLTVSTDRIARGWRWRMPAITGSTRLSSSFVETGTAPGRVDSPPTSMRSAPPSSMLVTWSKTSAAEEKNRPPSLKLSGVRFRMPMTSGRSRLSTRSRTVQLLGNGDMG